ncbi:hypothetical protein Peur_036141 [Populus x canadensis]
MKGFSLFKNKLSSCNPVCYWSKLRIVLCLKKKAGNFVNLLDTIVNGARSSMERNRTILCAISTGRLLSLSKVSAVSIVRVCVELDRKNETPANDENKLNRTAEPPVNV